MKHEVRYWDFILNLQDASAAEDDDDLDLFGDETEEDKKVAEEREAAKKSAKKKESEMSLKSWLSFLLNVKASLSAHNPRCELYAT